MQQQAQNKTCAKYCAPGSILNLRRKQMQTCRGNEANENNSANKGNENTSANEIHEDTSANEVNENTAANYSANRELQERCDEHAEVEPQITNTTAESSGLIHHFP